MAQRLKVEGYGQLELNQVAFRRDGRIEAQCKIANDIDFVENGMILAIDPVKREVKMPTGSDDLVALNYTAEHMYDEREVGALKNFRLFKNSFLPRLGYLATGDKFTTNCLAYTANSDGTFDNDDTLITALKKNDGSFYGKVSTTGALELVKSKEGAIAKVVKATTMPDGQFAVQFIVL